MVVSYVENENSSHFAVWSNFSDEIKYEIVIRSYLTTILNAVKFLLMRRHQSVFSSVAIRVICSCYLWYRFLMLAMVYDIGIVIYTELTIIASERASEVFSI